MIARRSVLTGLGAAALKPGLAAQARPLKTQYPNIDSNHLWLRHTATGEEVHVPFRAEAGQLLERGHARLCWAFRDWRDGDASIWMDPRLFDFLARMQTRATRAAGFPVRITLISGFRTARRNRGLEGAAINSQHSRGRAADIGLTGLSHSQTALLADAMGAPGLGRYPGFTHIDVGPSGRRWSG
ncbi:MAG: DUF882 domain-containing protein [Pseudomonadota bacterium]